MASKAFNTAGPTWRNAIRIPEQLVIGVLVIIDGLVRRVDARFDIRPQPIETGRPVLVRAQTAPESSVNSGRSD